MTSTPGAFAPVSALPSSGPARPRLTRSRSQKILGGVAGGLAEHTGVDVVLWRLAFLALTLAGGSGVLIYGLLWLLLPTSDEQPR